MIRRFTPPVPRRTFLQALAVLFAGFGRRLRAQGRRFRLRFHPLARPVLVPRETLAEPNRVRRFRANGVSLPTAAVPGQPIRVNGMVVRTSDADDAPDRFRAVCVVCPHERCEVDFVGDPADLHRRRDRRDRPGRSSRLSLPLPQQRLCGRRRPASRRPGPAGPLPLPRHRRHRDERGDRRGGGGRAPVFLRRRPVGDSRPRVRFGKSRPRRRRSHFPDCAGFLSSNSHRFSIAHSPQRGRRAVQT